ncbi:hypothetical protein [Haloferax gibbonsii]|uniref:Uncharacterized protein n=1 Tax=Haloferax gibbonsii TaxID=35746 RepID=A0A0K1J022_HALGI|nr:hypothetical protein [Haloferax gibbonsii]AKU09895.1 hypothetical protein ABY42_18935 [Haloferax gibbonsii]
MQRRTFLSAAAVLATHPTTAVAEVDADGDTSLTKMCEICGGEKPAEMVDHVSVDTIAPFEADICAACNHVQNHWLDEGQCMQCGDEIGRGFHIEVKFPLGESGLPGMLAGELCGDCAGWVACDINYESVDADEDAHKQLIEILNEEKRRMNKLEETE